MVRTTGFNSFYAEHVAWMESAYVGLSPALPTKSNQTKSKECGCRWEAISLPGFYLTGE